MDYFFLNSVLQDADNSEGTYRLYELIKYSHGSFMEWTLHYYEPHELQALYDAVLAKVGNSNNFDFKLDGSYLMWNGPTVLEERKELERLKALQVINFSNTIPTFYSLLRELISSKAIYVDKSLSDSIVGDNLDGSSFDIVNFQNLTVSKSTMNMSFSIPSSEGFYSRSLVSLVDTQLQLHEFLCLVPVDVNVLRDGVTKLGTCNYAGVTMDVIKVEPLLSLFCNVVPRFHVYESIVNHNVFISDRNKVAIDFLSRMIKDMEKLLFTENRNEISLPNNRAAGREASPWSVTIKLRRALPNRDRLTSLQTFAIDLVNGYSAGKFQLLEVAGLVARHGCDKLEEYAVLAYMKGMSTPVSEALMALAQEVASTSPEKAEEVGRAISLEKLNNLRQIIVHLRNEKVMTDIHLFAYRAQIYLTDYRFPDRSNNIDSMFTNITDLEISGGKSPYTSRIIKKLPPEGVNL